jgi:hypothetical protein
MNADLIGLLEYMKAHKNKNLTGIIESGNGYRLSDKEARAYVCWCVKSGYKTLHDAPDFEIVKIKL